MTCLYSPRIGMSYTIGKLLNSAIPWTLFHQARYLLDRSNSLYFPVAIISRYTVLIKQNILDALIYWFLKTFVHAKAILCLSTTQSSSNTTVHSPGNNIPVPHCRTVWRSRVISYSQIHFVSSPVLTHAENILKIQGLKYFKINTLQIIKIFKLIMKIKNFNGTFAILWLIYWLLLWLIYWLLLKPIFK